MKIFTLTLFLLISSSYGFTHTLFSGFANNCAIKKENEVPYNRKNNASFFKPGFKVGYYRCKWETDPAIRYIRGEITAFFSFSATMKEISFDLKESLKVDSVIRKNENLLYLQRNDSLIIQLAAEAKAGDMDSLTIFYEGVPGISGNGTYANGIQAGLPVMWTLSEPFGSRDWWPCQNGLENKADSIDIYITSPAAYTSVSNGIRQSVTINGDKKTSHWKHRYPIASYLVCMAVAHYEEFTETFKIGVDSLFMQTFCYPASLALFKEKTRLIYGTFDYFTGLLGPYPFINEKYGHTQFGWGGGMEHQTNTFLSTPDESLMAHELAHQWFGNTITPGRWNDIWLSEGFATLLASLDIERKYPLTFRETRKKEIEYITSLPGGSVFVEEISSSTRIFDARLSYSKGAKVLNTLRWILGDTLFLKGVNKYLEDTSLRFGFANTADLQRNMEKASGKDLRNYFKDWVYGQGYPSYKVQWSQVGSDYASITMHQATSDPSVPFFALPVPLLFKNSTQQKTLVLNNTFNGEVFFEKIGFIADSVFIDPDYWLISKNNVTEKIIADTGSQNKVLIYPNPVSELLVVYLKNMEGKTASLKIFDGLGKIILSDNINFAGLAAYQEFHLPHLSPGIYYLYLRTDKNWRVVKKIFKK